MLQMEAAHRGERQIDLQECWLKDQELKEYFRTNCQEGHQVCLAVQLIREAIAARKKQGQGSMQSNLMSTVKRRGKEVTPKVTQIQPPKSENIRIFGKPRVKLDEGRNCVVHEDFACENCLNSIAKVNKREEKTAVEEGCIRMRTDYD